MKIKKLNFARFATSFVLAAAVALVPFANTSAATNIWNNTTDLAFGTATNWSTGAVPLDGDSIVFDSTNTTTPYPGSASLTNATGNAFVGLTATGTTGSYNFTIDNFKATDGAILMSDAPTTNIVTITNLTAQGDITLDGINATNITVIGGGTVTIKNTTSSLPVITNAGDVVLEDNGTVTQSEIAAIDQLTGKTITLSGTVTPTNLTLTSNALGLGYSFIVASASTLTIPVSGSAYTTPIRMAGGQIRVATAGTVTVSTLSVTANSEYYIPASGFLYASAYTISNGVTFVPAFGSSGVFTGTPGNGGGTGGTGGATGGTGSTGGTGAVVPTAPNTAFTLALSNPLVIGLAVIAMIGASIGILRLRKQQQ